MKPLYVIELDDSSHRSADAQKRDLVKDKALKDAGLRIIRIPARTSYSQTDLEAAFRANSLAEEPCPAEYASSANSQAFEKTSETLSQASEP